MKANKEQKVSFITDLRNRQKNKAIRKSPFGEGPHVKSEPVRIAINNALGQYSLHDIIKNIETSEWIFIIEVLYKGDVLTYELYTMKSDTHSDILAELFVAEKYIDTYGLEAMSEYEFNAYLI